MQVLMETEKTFRVICRNDAVVVLKKSGTVFLLDLPEPEGEPADPAVAPGKRVSLSLYGNQLLCRPADRANKKFKQRNTVAL